MGSLFDEKLRGKHCQHCRSTYDEENMIICDKCEATYHRMCALSKGMVVHDGPFFCHHCRGTIAMEGASDVMEDYMLMDYLFTGVLPKDLEEL
jgi:predicted sulfurtransferase